MQDYFVIKCEAKDCPIKEQTVFDGGIEYAMHDHRLQICGSRNFKVEGPYNDIVRRPTNG